MDAWSLLAWLLTFLATLGLDTRSVIDPAVSETIRLILGDEVALKWVDAHAGVPVMLSADEPPNELAAVVALAPADWPRLRPIVRIILDMVARLRGQAVEDE